MARIRKQALGACAALVAVAVACAAAWFLWLPNHRPELRPGERYGIDVSHHQGPIDWHRVAEDGISFTYIKASEGSSFADPSFHANWWGAGEAGIDRGAYHFFSLCSPGVSQAANFLAIVPGQLELPPAVDLEISPDCRARPAAAVVVSELEAFIDRVEQDLADETVLYVGDDFEAAYPSVTTLDRPRWRLRFLLRPATDDWVIWQVGSVARVGGIDGPVGLDVLRIDQH